MDPAVAPGGVLPGQPQYQLHRPRGQGWPARTALLGIRPSASNQVSMPSQQGLGLHEEPTPASLWHKPTQPSQDRPVRWPQSRTLDLTTQDRDLVSEHDDLDRQFVLFAPAKPEQLEYPNEGHIEEGQRHGQSSLALCPQAKSTWTAWMGFSAPTRSMPMMRRPAATASDRR